MSAPSESPTTSTPTTTAGGRTAVRLVGVVAILALVAWFGVRIKDAIATKKAEETERTAAASTAAATEARRGRGEGAEIKSVSGRPVTWLPEVAIDGTLNPIEEAELTFKSPGRVAAVRVKVGQDVRPGDVLAVLESAEAQAQVEAARAQVKSVEAQLAMVKDSSARVDTLVKKGAGSEAMGIEAQGRETLTAAQVEAARASLKLAEVTLRNHTLTAPFGGTVTRTPSGPGAVINPGIPGPALFHLSDTRRLKLVGSVAEADARLVKVGGEVRIRHEGRELKGKLTAVLGSMDPMTRRVPVEAEVDNSGPEKLLAGSYVKATLVGAAAQNVLSFPPTVLRPGAQDEVMVVEKGRLRARRISFVFGDAGAVLVRSGLEKDDVVWLEPTNEAKDGDLVASSK